MSPTTVFRGDAALDGRGRTAALSVYEDGSALIVFTSLSMSSYVHLDPGEVAKVRALFNRAEAIRPAPDAEVPR